MSINGIFKCSLVTPLVKTAPAWQPSRCFEAVLARSLGHYLQRGFLYTGLVMLQLSSPSTCCWVSSGLFLTHQHVPRVHFSGHMLTIPWASWPSPLSVFFLLYFSFSFSLPETPSSVTETCLTLFSPVIACSHVMMKWDKLEIWLTELNHKYVVILIQLNWDHNTRHLNSARMYPVSQ